VASVQLCDGPDIVDPARIVDEARCDRWFLGEGMFPLVDLVAATQDAPIALEIPAERLRLQGVSALRRAERAYRSFRTLFG
jgi:hypothetical protein